MKPIINLLTILILLSSCSSKSDIEGRWERVNHDFEGSILEIIKTENESFEGRILAPNSKMKEFTYEINEVYLKDINLLDNKRYRGNALVKGFDKNGDQNFFYKEVTIQIDENDILVMSANINDLRLENELRWIRIKTNANTK